MNTQSAIRCAVVAAMATALAGLPLVVQGASNRSANDISVQNCMDQFAAKHFPDRKVTFIVTDDKGTLLPMPLAGSTKMRQLRLVANDPSGRVLATATCNVKASGGKIGNVTILPITVDK